MCVLSLDLVVKGLTLIDIFFFFFFFETEGRQANAKA